MKLTQDTTFTLNIHDGAIIMRQGQREGDVDLECVIPNDGNEMASDIAFTVAMLMWLLNSSSASLHLSQVVDEFSAELDKQKRKEQGKKCQ